MNRPFPDDMYNIDFAIHVGESFVKTLTLETESGTPMRLSGFTALGQIRPDPMSTTLTAEFLCQIESETGPITITLEKSVTATIPPGKYYYDICIERFNALDPANSRRQYLIGGKFLVLPSVTR